jgi:hypothetical protein
MQPEDARWHQWKAQGRADAARFRRSVRGVVADVAAVIAFATAVWFAFLI